MQVCGSQFRVGWLKGRNSDKFRCICAFGDTVADECELQSRVAAETG